MKLKITFLLLLVSFLGHAQLTNNIVVLKPNAITPLTVTLSGGSSKTMYGAYNVNTGQSSAWGTNNFGNCHGGGNTISINYTGGNGASYAAKSWGLAGGGTLTLPAGTLANGSGTLYFNFGGNVAANPNVGLNGYSNPITVFGNTFTVSQSAYTVTTWNQQWDTFTNCP